MQRQSTSLGEGTRDDRDGDVIDIYLFGGARYYLRYQDMEGGTLDEEHPLVELGDQEVSLSLLKNGTDD